MSQALLYTSAPQGLRQGAAGYCTVGSTPGMEPNLAEFLEGFSGYPHPFKPPDPRTSDNPINYSYIQWSIGGQRHYVLSRVCDSGLDYTGRTNLLAHHVVLTREEADACRGGPAWTMAADGFFIKKWERGVLTLTGPQPQTSDSPTGICTYWQAAAGDAGYAGILAEAALERGGRPVTVIFPAKLNGRPLDLLQLVIEAQRLLPPERRWNATFSTFYSRIYSSFDVQWRFLFDETTDARQARRDSRALVIDLCKGPLPRAVGGELVTAAREGGLRVVPKSAAPERSHAPSTPEVVRVSRPSVQAVASGPDDLRLRPPVREVDAPPITEYIQPLNPFQRGRRRSVILHYVVAGVGALVLTIVFALLLAVPIVSNRLRQKEVAEAAVKSAQASPAPRVEVPARPVAEAPATPGDAPPTDNPSIPPTADSVPTTPNTTSKPPSETTPTPASPPAELSVPPPTTPAPEPARKSPFDDKLRRERVLALPVYNNPISKQMKAAGTSPLTRIDVSTPDDCDLELIGKAEAFGATVAERIDLKSENDGKTKSWRVVMNPFVGKEQLIATFRLENQQLSFQWNKDVAKPDSLRRCLLRISAGTDDVLCRLAKPDPAEGIELAKLAKGKNQVEFHSPDGKPLDLTLFGGLESLRLEAQLGGVSEKVNVEPPGGIEAGKSQQFLINGKGTKAGYPVVGIRVEFKVEPSQKDDRKLEILAKAAYRTKGNNKDDGFLDDTEAVKASSTDFDVKGSDGLNAEIRKGRVSVSKLDGQVNKAEMTLKNIRLINEPKIKVYENMIQKLTEERHDAAARKHEATKLLKDREIGDQKNFMKPLLTQIDNAANELAEKERLKQESREKLEANEAMLAMITSVQEKGRLEYRVYFEIPDQEKENQIIELYRSKGFTDK